MLKRVFFMSVFFSVMLVASMAGANTVMLAETGVTPATAVSIHAGTLGDLSAYAGNYKVQLGNLQGPTYLGFCVDPVYAPSGFQPYELTQITRELGGGKYLAAAWVLDQYHTGSSLSAAAQIAVWELVWDWQTGTGARTSDFNNGLFKLRDTTTNYANLLQQASGIYVDAINAFNNGTSADDAVVGKYVLASNEGFNAGTQDYVISTPIPAAI